jgi:hypothetical protein
MELHEIDAGMHGDPAHFLQGQVHHDRDAGDKGRQLDQP